MHRHYRALLIGSCAGLLTLWAPVKAAQDLGFGLGIPQAANGVAAAPPITYSIAFNNAAYVGNNAGSGNFSAAFNNTASAPHQLLVVCVVGTTTNNPSSVIGVTYNSVPLTLGIYEGNGSAAPRWTYEYYLLNPAAGSNALAVTQSGGDYLVVTAATYTGAKQSGQPDNTAAGSTAAADTLTTGIATNNANAWVTGCGQCPTAVAVGANETQRAYDTSFDTMLQFDSGGPVASPSTTSYTTMGTTTAIINALVSFQPG